MRVLYAFKARRHNRLSLIFFFIVLAQAVYAQRLAPEKIVEGKLRVKVSQALAARLENAAASRTRPADGSLATGHATLDAVGRQYKATAMRRVFRPAGRFEAKHRKYGLHLWYEIDIDPAQSAKNARIAFGALEHISRVETVRAKVIENFSAAGSAGAPQGWDGAPNDTHYTKQWHYENTGQSGGTTGADIKLRQAWKIETGTPDVVVAVVDGGVQYDHPDLAANMWHNTGETAANNFDDDGNGYVDDIYGYSFADNQGTPIPLDHGTHVAGTIAAVTNNGTGVAGIAGGSGKSDGVRIMTTAVLGNYGGGGFEEAYVYAADNGAVISQNSWTYDGADVYEQSVLDAIDYFIAEAGRDEHGNQTGPMNGGIVIFSAGNNNYHGNYYPGYHEPIIAVGATNDLDKKASYSNYGKWIDISAPGGDTRSERYVLSTVTGSKYAYMSGTSQACPHVSGVAALLVSKYGGPGFTPGMLRKRLLETADNIDALNPDYTGEFGSGRLNAGAALSPNDAIPPAQVKNLTATNVQVSSITLTWTAPADGTASAYAYDLRYATSVITEANFAEATTAAGLQTPAKPGMTETLEVTGLEPAQKYYFAIRATDFFRNQSAISNVVSATTALNPALEVSPASITAELRTAETSTRELTLSNTGEGPLQFSITHPGYVTLSEIAGSIAPGADLAIQVTIDAHSLSAGTYDAPLIINTNQSNKAATQVPVALHVADLGAPRIEATPASVDFGSVFQTLSITKILTLQNAGTEPLEVQGITSANTAFATDFTEPFTLAPFESRPIAITYTASTRVTTQSILTISTNDPAHEVFSVTLKGQGIAAPNATVSPASVTKALNTGSTTTQSVRITNPGGNPLQYSVGSAFETKGSALIRVLILSPDYDLKQFETFLDEIPNVQSDVFQHSALPSIALDDLTPYNVVVVTNEAEWMYEGSVSPIRIGDLLAGYIDQGGKVIVNNQVYDDEGWGIKGRFVDEQYGPFFKSNSESEGRAELGSRLISTHPLLEGVHSLGYSGFSWDLETTPGSSVIAQWSDGRVFAAAKNSVVGFNMIPFSGGQAAATGDFARLYENAIHWLLGNIPVQPGVTQGTIAAGAYADVVVTLNAAGYATGTYTGTLDIYTNAPASPKISVPVTLNVTGPQVSVSEESIDEETGAGQTVVRKFTLTNHGAGPVPYAIYVANTDVIIAETNSRHSETSRAAAARSTAPRLRTIDKLSMKAILSPGMEQGAAAARVAGTPVYATGFESFSKGDVNGQGGWNGYNGYGLWTIASDNPAQGLLGLHAVSDGGGDSNVNTPFRSTSGHAQVTTASLWINFDRAAGEEWHIVPQAISQGTVVTHFVLNANGKMAASVSPQLGSTGSQYLEIVQNVPRGYFMLSIEVEKGTGHFDIYFNDRKVFSGNGSSDVIDNMAFYSPMTKSGAALDIDNVRILEGSFRELGGYLDVSPLSGTLAAGESKEIQATFNAGVLPFGTYIADIVVTAGNVQYVTIPTTLNVHGDAALGISEFYENFQVYYKEDSIQRFTLFNRGGAPIAYSLGAAEGMQQIVAFAPADGTIPVGGQQEIEARLITATLVPGPYEADFIITSNAGDDITPKLSFTVLEPPVISLQANELAVSVPEGNWLNGSIGVSNRGESGLRVQTLMGSSAWDGTVRPGQGFSIGNLGTLDGTDALISPNQVAATQKTYRARFDPPANGTIGNQQGWYSPTGDWVSDNGSGYAIVEHAPDGSGIPSMVFSPVVAPSDAKLSSVTLIYMAPREVGNTYQLILQSVSESKIVTRFQVSPGGVKALVRDTQGKAVFQNIDYSAIPGAGSLFTEAGGSVAVRIDVDRATSIFTIYFYNIKVFQGQGFAGGIEQVIILSSDDTGGDHTPLAANGLAFGESASWLSAEPAQGMIPAGHTYQLPVHVNTIGLLPGYYEDVIRVMSNDPAKGEVVIPVKITITAPAMAVASATLDVTAIAGKQSGSESITLTNTGEGDLSYVFLGYGLGASQLKLPRTNTSPASAGGPDGHGYSWITSASANGPRHEWNDISGTGVRLILRGTVIKPIELPFSFPYYDQTYNRVTVTSWGMLRFDYELMNPSEFISFAPIPNIEGPNNFIAAAGAHIKPTGASGIFYQADEEKLVVQYTDVSSEYFPHERNTYQVILYKDGSIKFVYKELHYTLGMIGIESPDGTEGLQLEYLVDFDIMQENSTVLITRSPLWLQPQIPEGTLGSGQRETIPFTFDAAALEPGLYHATLFIGSNDPQHRVTSIPITFTVKEAVTGTEGETATVLKVYPVPTDNTLHVTFHKPLPQGAWLTIGNAQGQVVYRAEVPPGAEAHQLSFEDLKAGKGLYYLKVDTGTWVEVRKVIRN